MKYLSLLFVFLLVGCTSSPSVGITGNVAKPVFDDAQVVNLSFRNGNYYPSVITVQVNKPVRIVADSSIISDSGCFRSFDIPDFEVVAYFYKFKNFVEFIPDKIGKFPFSCSMGMYFGTFVVE